MFVYLYNIFSIPFYRMIFTNKRTFYKVVCFQLFLIIALRADDLGADSVTYMRCFNEIRTYSFSEIMSAFSLLQSIFLPDTGFPAESGYVLFNWIIGGLLGLPYRVFLILVAFINVYAMYRFLDRHSDSPLIGAFFFADVVFINWFYIVRRTLSLSVMFLAFTELEEKHYFRASVMAVIAVLFHRTALVMVGFFFLSFFRLSRRFFRRAMLWGTILSMAGSVLLGIAVRYILTTLGKGGITIGFKFDIMLFACLVLAWTFYLLINFKKVQSPETNLFVILIVMIAATFTANSYINMVRLMFFVFQPLLLIAAVNALNRYRYRSKYLKYILFICIFLVLLIHASQRIYNMKLFSDPNYPPELKISSIDTLYPYRTIFD